MDWRQVTQVLTDLRRQSGMAQTEVAERLAVVPSTLSRWESDDPERSRTPPHDKLEAWAELFGLRVVYGLLPTGLAARGARAQAMSDAMTLIASASDRDVEAFATMCRLLVEGVEAKRP